MISRKDVEHIARLARIELSEAEKARFKKELSAILDFVVKLGEVDTSRVEPMAGGTELMNVMREDRVSVPRAADSGQELVGAAPKTREGYVEAKAVFKRE